MGTKEKSHRLYRNTRCGLGRFEQVVSREVSLWEQRERERDRQRAKGLTNHVLDGGRGDIAVSPALSVDSD